VLLASLLEAIGIPTRLAFVPRHVYVEAYIPDAPRRYQQDGWVSLDATCKECDFGEVMWQFRDTAPTYRYA
jgi:transglutaminase-like putative cysteine protease